MLDLLLVLACIAVVALPALFVFEKYRRMKIQQAWQHHGAYCGDMDSPTHRRDKTLSARFLERSATAVVASTVQQGATMTNKFMEKIRGVLGSGRERRRGNGPDNGCPGIPPSDISADQDAPSRITPAENGPPKSGDIEIKIKATRCDLHPLYVLRPTVIDILLPDSTTPGKVKTSRCTKERCYRHYMPECGYFDFVSGENPTVNGLDEKPACSIHRGNYMAVVKTNRNFAWACLNPGCGQTVPYQEA